VDAGDRLLTPIAPLVQVNPWQAELVGDRPVIGVKPDSHPSGSDTQRLVRPQPRRRTALLDQGQQFRALDDDVTLSGNVDDGAGRRPDADLQVRPGDGRQGTTRNGTALSPA